MKILSILTVLVCALSPAFAMEKEELRATYKGMQEQHSYFDFWTETFWMALDLLQGKQPTSSVSPTGRFKAKHDKTAPQVRSLATDYMNQGVLFTSIGVMYGCYTMAWFPLFINNDAGAFFTDCLTMWTMYVFFFQDPEAINYSY